MPKVSEYYPKRFISGDELNGQIVTGIIREVKEEKVNENTDDEEDVLVIYLDQNDRGISLNKTRAGELKDITGSDDTDEWQGHAVQMYTVKQSAFGKIHNVIHFQGVSEQPTDKPF